MATITRKLITVGKVLSSAVNSRSKLTSNLTTLGLRNCKNQSFIPKQMNFNLGSKMPMCTSTAKLANQPKTANITFKFGNGEKQSVQAKIGDNLLDVVIDNDVDIDGYGACEGTLACSTCHLIFKQDYFDALPNKPGDEELDMLDLAYALTDTSRLGCQVIVTKEMDGWEIEVPEGIADAREP